MSAGGSARSGDGVDATTETEQGGRADAALRLLDQLARADGANGLASSSEGDASQTTVMGLGNEPSSTETAPTLGATAARGNRGGAERLYALGAAAQASTRSGEPYERSVVLAPTDIEGGLADDKLSWSSRISAK